MIKYTEQQEKNLRYNLEDTLLYYIDAKQLDPVIDSILQLFSTVLGKQETKKQDDSFEDGHSEGYEEGYEEGYSDGIEVGRDQIREEYNLE